MCFRGRENTVPLTFGEDRWSDFPGWLSLVSDDVCARKLICLLVRASKGIVFGGQPSLLTSYQCFLLTQVYMTSRISVQRHWRFEHYLQSLCHLCWPLHEITLYSWPSWLWNGNCSPPSPKPHHAMNTRSKLTNFILEICWIPRVTPTPIFMHSPYIRLFMINR